MAVGCREDVADANRQCTSANDCGFQRDRWALLRMFPHSIVPGIIMIKERPSISLENGPWALFHDILCGLH